MTRPRQRLHENACRGFALLALLFFISVSMFALSGVVTVWTTAAHRDREAELLFVGKQYRQAIESYFRSSPGVGQLPQKLEDLLADSRSGVLKRHLRKLYPDPMTGEANWGLVMVGDRIAGVYSVSAGAPFKLADLDLPGIESAATYQDWKFVFAGATASTSAGAAAPGSMTAGLPLASDAPASTAALAASQEPSPLAREACNRQRQLDSQECLGVRGYAGVTKDAIEACLASLEQRQEICALGLAAQAPPLAIPQVERSQ